MCRVCAVTTQVRFDEKIKLRTWQKAHEKPVPTLCLTSPEDTIVTEASARAAAAELVEAQPSRSVTITCLKGSHCQMLIRDPQAYRASVKSFLKTALPDAGVAP